LVLFSIMHEKEIGEKHGRKALRWVLRQTAQSVDNVLRRVDMFGRWNSGKFLLILPVAEKSLLNDIFRRIERALRKADFGVVPDVCIELRWSCWQAGESAESLIARTQAKHVMLSLSPGDAENVVPMIKSL
ncbi:MAG: diguanylate cyclase, partial [Pseudomonadota bacterium]